MIFGFWICYFVGNDDRILIVWETELMLHLLFEWDLLFYILVLLHVFEWELDINWMRNWINVSFVISMGVIILYVSYFIFITGIWMGVGY